MSGSVAVIMLHPLCNMSCSFCVTDDAMGSFDLAQVSRLLDRLRGEGFKSVVIGGGEPTVWRHGLFELTQEAKRRGFSVQVGTNGILLPPGFEQIDSVDRWVLPLDGTTPRVHNGVRFYRDRHFDIVMNRIERLREAGKSTTISTVVTKINRDDIAGIGRLLLELDEPRPFLHAWHLYQFIPEGRGGSVHRDALLLDKSDYQAAVEPMKQMKARFQIFRRPDMLHSKTVEFFWMQDGLLHRQLGERVLAEAI
jgi:MoaA/NifB/PqqE/SkfB family radical SAM enzyme